MKTRTFPGAIIGDVKLSIISHSRKNPDKIALDVRTNDSPHVH